MIESINQAGGAGGGTVNTITAGTGISVDSTDPANPIITNTSLNTDETAKVSANDTTAGYLNGKLVAGSGITLTENNNGGNETLTVQNTAPGYTGITATVLDCENTTTKTDLVSITLASGTWLDGEAVVIEMDYEYLNNSGSNRTVTHFASGTGITETSGTQSWIADANVNRGWQIWRFVRISNQALSPNINFAHVMRINSGFPQSQAYVIDTSVDYSANITLKISLQFPVANASLYLRPLLVKAYKISAGQQ